MGCHGKNEISKTKEHLFLGQYFLHLSGPNEQTNTHNEMSYVFNLGLINPLAYYSLTMVISLIFKISLIFINMQMK